MLYFVREDSKSIKVYRSFRNGTIFGLLKNLFHHPIFVAVICIWSGYWQLHM